MYFLNSHFPSPDISAIYSKFLHSRQGQFAKIAILYSGTADNVIYTCLWKNKCHVHILKINYLPY